MFKYADPSKLGRSLLEGNEDHLLSPARSERMRQEHQVGSLKSCINELQQQAYVQGLELQDAHHGCMTTRRIIYEGKTILKYEIFMNWVR